VGLCAELRDLATALVDGFDIPPFLLGDIAGDWVLKNSFSSEDSPSLTKKFFGLVLEKSCKSLTGKTFVRPMSHGPTEIRPSSDLGETNPLPY